MRKIISGLLAAIMLLTGCMASENEEKNAIRSPNADSTMQSPASIQEQTSPLTSSKPSTSKQTELPLTDQTYTLDFKKELPPENITEKFECGYDVVMNPEKSIMILGVDDFLIWDCVKQKKTEVQELIGPFGFNNAQIFRQFLSDESVYAIAGMPVRTDNDDESLRELPEFKGFVNVDWGGTIVSVSGTVKASTFAYQLMRIIGKDTSLINVYYDPDLKRYYATAEVLDATDASTEEGFSIVRCAAAEYDSSYQLLNYIVAEDYEPIREKMGFVGNDIVAAGERRVLSSQNIEFNFNNSTWRKTDYLPDIRDLNLPGVINTYYSSHFDGGQFQFPHNTSASRIPSYALLGYENGQFQVFYGINEITKGQQPYEVQTEQGIIKMQYEVSGTAPRKDFYFTAPCEEYTWTVQQQWESLLGAESYKQGAFKAITDGTVQFICPLPDDVEYIGEDINGLSYFYDRRKTI